MVWFCIFESLVIVVIRIYRWERLKSCFFHRARDQSSGKWLICQTLFILTLLVRPQLQNKLKLKTKTLPKLNHWPPFQIFLERIRHHIWSFWIQFFLRFDFFHSIYLSLFLRCFTRFFFVNSSFKWVIFWAISNAF